MPERRPDDIKEPFVSSSTGSALGRDLETLYGDKRRHAFNQSSRFLTDGDARFDARDFSTAIRLFQQAEPWLVELGDARGLARARERIVQAAEEIGRQYAGKLATTTVESSPPEAKSNALAEALLPPQAANSEQPQSEPKGRVGTGDGVRESGLFERLNRPLIEGLELASADGEPLTFGRPPSIRETSTPSQFSGVVDVFPYARESVVGPGSPSVEPTAHIIHGERPILRPPVPGESPEIRRPGRLFEEVSQVLTMPGDREFLVEAGGHKFYRSELVVPKLPLTVAYAERDGTVTLLVVDFGRGKMEVERKGSTAEEPQHQEQDFARESLPNAPDLERLRAEFLAYMRSDPAGAKEQAKRWVRQADAELPVEQNRTLGLREAARLISEIKGITLHPTQLRRFVMQERVSIGAFGEDGELRFSLGECENFVPPPRLKTGPKTTGPDPSS